MRRRILLVVAVSFLVVLVGCAGGISETDSAPVETAESEDGPSTTGADSTTNRTLSIYRLTVGRGASTLVVGPTSDTMLVDTGDWSDAGEFGSVESRNG